MAANFVVFTGDLSNYIDYAKIGFWHAVCSCAFSGAKAPDGLAEGAQHHPAEKDHPRHLRADQRDDEPKAQKAISIRPPLRRAKYKLVWLAV